MAAPESSILTSRIPKPVLLREALEVADEDWLNARQKNCLGAGPTTADDDHYLKTVKAAFTSALNITEYGFNSTGECLANLEKGIQACYDTQAAHESSWQVYGALPSEMRLDLKILNAMSNYVKCIGPLEKLIDKLRSARTMIGALDDQLDTAALSRLDSLFPKAHNMLRDKLREQLEDLKKQHAAMLGDRKHIRQLGFSPDLFNGGLATLQERMDTRSRQLREGEPMKYKFSAYASVFLFHASVPEPCQTIESILNELQPVASTALNEARDVLESFKRTRNEAKIANDHARRRMRIKTSKAKIANDHARKRMRIKTSKAS